MKRKEKNATKQRTHEVQPERISAQKYLAQDLVFERTR